ncbi:hypothetical protein ACFU9B_42950 [Streptomyces sp. NPDC057592]|uniref:hypothetical protein n=1 Tax=unclassified Streptomyces TaxID=2593676 RepID=UPI0036843FAA
MRVGRLGRTGPDATAPGLVLLGQAAQDGQYRLQKEHDDGGVLGQLEAALGVVGFLDPVQVELRGGCRQFGVGQQVLGAVVGS